jgi:hypothetical protein
VDVEFDKMGEQGVEMCVKAKQHHLQQTYAQALQHHLHHTREVNCTASYSNINVMYACRQVLQGKVLLLEKWMH